MKVSITQYIINKIKAAMGIVQDTDTATQAISKGKYVWWKGKFKKATSAISQGATLSASNLGDVSEGALNELNSHIGTLDTDVSSRFLKSKVNVVKQVTVSFTNNVAETNIKKSEFLPCFVEPLQTWDHHILFAFTNDQSNYIKIYMITSGGSATTNVTIKIHGLDLT